MADMDMTKGKWLPSRGAPLFPPTAATSPRSTHIVWGAWGVCIILMLVVIGYLWSERCGWFGLRPAQSNVGDSLGQISTLLAQPGSIVANVAAVQAYLQTVRPSLTPMNPTSSTLAVPPTPRPGLLAPAPPRVISTATPPSADVIVHRTLSDRVPAAQARGDGL